MSTTTAELTKSGQQIDLLPDVLKPSQVADIFHVDPKTVARWDKAGRLTSFRTPGGHRRYNKADVLEYRRGLR